MFELGLLDFEFSTILIVVGSFNHFLLSLQICLYKGNCLEIAGCLLGLTSLLNFLFLGFRHESLTTTNRPLREKTS